MKSKSIAIALIMVIMSLAWPVAAFGQKGSQKPPPKEFSREEIEALRRRAEERRKEREPLSAKNFHITQVEGDFDQFTILITDNEGRQTTNTVYLKEIIVLEAVMVAAKDFAQTEEAVGKNKPLTTRFLDKQAPAFIVDVSKSGDESRFFITVKGLDGAVTLDGGAVKRSDKEATSIFHDILARVQEAKANSD